MILENIKDQCINYLFDEYSISLSAMNYLVERERDSFYIFQADSLIIDYINDKEKRDYLFLQRLLNESQKNLAVYSNGNEYRVNDLNWDYSPLNQNNESFYFLKNLYKEHAVNVSEYLFKSEIYLNYQFEENFINLTIDHHIRSSINNELFNNKVLEIRISPLKKHYSRNHIIMVGKDRGSISLRFLSRNQDNLCFFNENINFDGIYIKNIMRPLNILCKELNSSKYTIIEVIIPFEIDNGIACFKDLSLNIASNHLPIITTPTNAQFSINTVYQSIEFRKLFSVFGKDSIEYPKDDNELYTIIDNYKLLRY